MKNLRKKSIAVLAGLAVVGLVGASAATLGGITSDNLGADADVVGSCDTNSVDVSYNTSLTGAPTSYFGVGSVDVGIAASTAPGSVAAACVGELMEVSLLDASGAEIANGSATVSGSIVNVSFAAAPDSELVEGIAIVIAG